ncbi:MAG: hypothetical protein K0Q72_3329 [Armatimonadetes bacterium]|jgi:hypothetical protein|nr:hypothetical protein [Armatimonadota bacterium]
MAHLVLEQQPVVDDYLARVRRSLDEVPADQREQLLAQARAKIELELEVHSDAGEVRETLRRLGEPDALAQWLRSNAPLTGASSEGRGRLAACRSCCKEVSTEAVTCPHCGAPSPARQAWRGWGYEWKSKQSIGGWPVVHVAFGRDEHGKLRVAKGVVAVGQFAIGGITFAQFGVGAVFALGQFVAAPIAIGQLGLGVLFGLGQLSTGYVAIGQFALGVWVRAMAGFGAHVWSMAERAPEAVEFFRRWLGR